MNDPEVSVEVAGVRFGKFGVSGWYRWNWRSWAPIPEPLWTEPMLDKVAHLQALIDAWAATPWQHRTSSAAERYLLGAATPKEDDRG